MIDLHTHSTASDGTLSPSALLDHAAERGITALALTDHDTLAGLAPARARARHHGIRFLGGIELSTVAPDGASVHLLGYGIEGAANTELRARCALLAEQRRTRARRMVERLNAAGVPVTFSAVLTEAGEGVIGRPHVARALVAGGWAADLKNAFERYLVPGSPGYVPYDRLTAAQGVRIITEAGGAAVLAHPGTLPESTLGPLVADLARHGLAGIEAYWAKHEPFVVDLCERLARRHHLIATGGSDFHGANKPDIELGMAAGGRVLPDDLFDQLESGVVQK